MALFDNVAGRKIYEIYWSACRISALWYTFLFRLCTVHFLWKSPSNSSTSRVCITSSVCMRIVFISSLLDKNNCRQELCSSKGDSTAETKPNKIELNQTKPTKSNQTKPSEQRAKPNQMKPKPNQTKPNHIKTKPNQNGLVWFQLWSAPRERSKNGNFSETAKYRESTPASRFTPKFVVRLATRTDKRGDAPTQSMPAQYWLLYFMPV